MKEQKIIITVNNEKKRDTAHTVLIFMAVFIVAFVVSMIITFWVKGSVPDALITGVFGGGGVELLLLAAITITKELKGMKQPEEQPEETDEKNIKGVFL